MSNYLKRSRVLLYWITLIFHVLRQLVLLVGAKLQHVIATLTLENAGITGYFMGTKLKPRDDLFWFKKPELLLSLIHFILFQVSSSHYIHFVFSSSFSLKSGLWCCIRVVELTCIFLSSELLLQNAFELASFFWFWVPPLSWLDWYSLSCWRWPFLFIYQTQIYFENQFLWFGGNGKKISFFFSGFIFLQFTCII